MEGPAAPKDFAFLSPRAMSRGGFEQKACCCRRSISDVHECCALDITKTFDIMNSLSQSARRWCRRCRFVRKACCCRAQHVERHEHSTEISYGWKTLYKASSTAVAARQPGAERMSGQIAMLQLASTPGRQAGLSRRRYLAAPSVLQPAAGRCPQKQVEFLVTFSGVGVKKTKREMHAWAGGETAKLSEVTESPRVVWSTASRCLHRGRATTRHTSC